MILSEPLRPKNKDGVLRVILLGRISKDTQDVKSIDSQHDSSEQVLRRLYNGPIEIRRFGDQASGWLADRECVNEVQELIESGDWDLVMVGELREAFRNPRFQWAFAQDCCDNDVRFISLAEGIDTADEEWESRMHYGALLAGMAVPETRRRVKRKATHAFSQGGMVLKVKFGYRRLTKEEADGGEFGPKGLRIARVAGDNECLRRMRDFFLRGLSYERVAQWLNDEGVSPGPYVSGGRWTGRLVADLLRDPILSGKRQFRKAVSKLNFGRGKNKARSNPKPPELQEYPELAHFTPAEHQELLAAMDARKADAAKNQSTGRDSSLYNQPRARSLWPGQHAHCGVCGGLMYRYGVLLKCQNALGKGPKTCWNRVLVRISEVHAQVVPLVLQYLERVPSVRAVLVQAAWKEYQRTRVRRNRSSTAIEDRIKVLEKEKANLVQAIRQEGLLPLVEELARVDAELVEAKGQQTSSTDEGQCGTYRSAAEIGADLEEAAFWLARTSRDFAEILRRMIPTFVVYPVQALDSGQVHPRARITVSAAGWATEGEEVASLQATLDLFDPPDQIKYVPVCVEARCNEPGLSLRELGARLKVNYMTVKRALAYHRLMDAEGVADPFRELTECPADASRWGKRAGRDERPA